MSSDIGRFNTTEKISKVPDDRCIMHEDDSLHQAIAPEVSDVYRAERIPTLTYLWRYRARDNDAMDAIYGHALSLGDILKGDVWKTLSDTAVSIYRGHRSCVQFSTHFRGLGHSGAV